MKSAVMQPYLFPYLGYYQLVNSVDKFVFYDDVNFIKRGYINRNNILVNGQAQRFTLPVPGATQNKHINEFNFSPEVAKILTTIKQAYAKAPFFKEVYPLIEKVFTQTDRRVSILCRASIKEVFDYLGIQKELFISSELNYERELPAAERLISISNLLNCKQYINSPGGVELYDKDFFMRKGVDLAFIKMNSVSYKQAKNEFVPYLSMIDVLMWNDIEEVKLMLNQYELF
ncbi:hypothetical protein CWC14_04980 [Pseudoalteromonas sp. S3260]|uniref:WbqC family protein n=1 Tax=Pseudoalteromonas sp. S3260 TaxID=579534 RepID=UPI00110AA6EE|nr:WbqC family protein [Pseudoalteromonas sp. S3260]TMO99299.1 hypothetical protein CWC14_04980 [Pseudoalteromonas sp. S3260]